MAGEFDPAILSPYYRYQMARTTIGPLGTLVVLRPPNPNRVMLKIACSVPGSTYAPGPSSNAANGFQFVTAEQPIVMSYSDFGGVLADQWCVLSGGAGATCSWLEVLYYPTGG